MIEFDKGKKVILRNQDCMEFMKEIPDNFVDLIVTDPPYKIITGGDKNGKNSVRPQGILRGNRKLFKNNQIKISEWMPELYRVLKCNAHCYVFSNSLNLKDMLNLSEQCGFKLVNLLVWEKNNCTPSQYYMKNCEYVLLLRKGKAKWINNIGASKTVHRFNNIISNKTHPTEKPVELMRFYIENSSNENDIVLDPFMGAGSTGVACIETNRRFIGCEIEKSYFETVKDRICSANAQIEAIKICENERCGVENK